MSDEQGYLRSASGVLVSFQYVYLILTTCSLWVCVFWIVSIKPYMHIINPTPWLNKLNPANGL